MGGDPTFVAGIEVLEEFAPVFRDHASAYVCLFPTKEAEFHVCKTRGNLKVKMIQAEFRTVSDSVEQGVHLSVWDRIRGICGCE